MVIVTTNKRIIIEPEAQFWKRITKVAKALDHGENPPAENTLSYPTYEAFRKSLTPKRLKILKTIKRVKPESVKELSEVMNTDYKNLLKNVNELYALGLVAVRKNGKIHVPIACTDKLTIEIPI